MHRSVPRGDHGGELGLADLRHGARHPPARADERAAPRHQGARRGPPGSRRGSGDPRRAAPVLGEARGRIPSCRGARSGRVPGAGAEEGPAPQRWRRRGRCRAGPARLQGREAQGGDGRDPRRDRFRLGGERRGLRQDLRAEGRGMRHSSLTPPVPGGGPFGATPSFVALLAAARPDAGPRSSQPNPDELRLPHGTTVVGLKFADGVVFAGDRRATEGYAIADDKMEKVFAADDLSAIAIAGAAGQAAEIVKLFQLELEHYEKITGDRLSLEGKANRLGQMIRGNFPLAMQGLVVVPLFGGFDVGRDEGRLFYYDATGGRWEEQDFHATGSGGRPAKSSLKKRWRPGLDRSEALRVAVEALVDASQEDAATGGPDPARGIYPTVVIVSGGGAETAGVDEIGAAYQQIVGTGQTGSEPGGAA